ncbi:MAG TPA: ATP-binding protein [Bryobacteraceae bacterium]|jgi:hypothetical protein|nr:ATP-binding protein [Bryobacteraceae bacterium]
MAPVAEMMTIDSIDRQREYVKAQRQKGKGLGVVFADAFLRGMRDLGYKSPAWAMAEQIDNAIQAGAETVSVHFGFRDDNKSKAKPDMVALIDNGNGMIPEMIGYAVRWGGTDREGDRTGFGRYGYGLPSSAVSMAKRYTVYSKASGADWHAVTVDIDELSEHAGDLEATEKLLTAKRAKLPKWVQEIGKPLKVGNLDSGTVIVLEDLDRLRSLPGWIKAETLRAKLLQYFGVIYRHWVPEHRIFVDGTEVQAVDPLFLMEHGRFYNETSVRAERIDTRTFEIETSSGVKGKISIRASLLPPNFQSADPSELVEDRRGAKTNKRWETMRDFNGLLICRQGRQIDCVSPYWTKFQTYDANIKIEIDFDPALDEYFGITTAKQQIVIAEEMWDRLRQNGKSCGDLGLLIRSMRERREELRAELKARAENRETEEAPRRSVAAMEETEKFKGPVPEPTSAQKAEAEKNLQEAARQRAQTTGEAPEKALEHIAEKAHAKRWEIDFAGIPEGPFYRPMRLGEQKRLIINTEHPFYSKVYNAAVGPDARAALEVLLFVLAERELETRGEAETFYKSERNKWSERLRQALDVLLPNDSVINRASSVAEHLYMASEESGDGMR